MSTAEQNIAQRIPKNNDNAASPLTFSYRPRVMPQSFIIGAGFALLGFYFVRQADALKSNYEMLVFGVGYGTLIACLSSYATQKNRTLVSGILYGAFLFWLIFLLSQIVLDGPLAWLHYEKMPPWIIQVFSSFITILGAWFLMWSALNFRLLRYGHAVTITSQGLILNDRNPVIPWECISRAEMLFNPAWPKQKTVIRLYTPGFSGTSISPYGPMHFRRQGLVVIPFMLIENGSLLIDSLTQHLGNRFEK